MQMLRTGAFLCWHNVWLLCNELIRDNALKVAGFAQDIVEEEITVGNVKSSSMQMQASHALLTATPQPK